MKEKGGMEEVMRGERKGCCIILFALYYFFFQWQPLVGIQGWSPPFSFGGSDLSPVTESQAILEYKGLSMPSSIPLILQLWKLRTSLLFSSSVMPNSWWPHDLQDATLLCPSLSPRVCSNSCLLSQWCHPNIWSSIVPFSSYPQSFPASGSFQMSWLFTTGGQSIGASASVSVLPANTQSWFPLGLTGWISSLSKGLWRVSSNTTVQKYQFFSAQPSLWSNSHIPTQLLQKP